MSQTFTLALTGVSNVVTALTRLGTEAQPALRAALYAEGRALLTDSLALVPRMDSVLAGSGTVQEVTASVPTVVVGYGGAAAPYALSVHENPRSGKTGGIGPSGQQYKKWAQTGQWKYLEQPYKALVPQFSAHIAAFLRARLVRGG